MLENDDDGWSRIEMCIGPVGFPLEWVIRSAMGREWDGNGKKVHGNGNYDVELENTANCN